MSRMPKFVLDDMVRQAAGEAMRAAMARAELLDDHADRLMVFMSAAAALIGAAAAELHLEHPDMAPAAVEDALGRQFAEIAGELKERQRARDMRAGPAPGPKRGAKRGAKGGAKGGAKDGDGRGK